MQKKFIILFIALGIPLCSTIFAQSFGQNKVQYRQFDWSYLSTPHFDIYFYGEEVELARFTLEAANEAYEQISKHLRWTLKKRVPIIVYHSHNDFQTTNVVGTYMQEGIGGVTELFKNRVVIPFEGDYTQFRHVIHHELVHAVINDMIYGGRMQNVISNRNALRLPLWVNEGLAEYLSSNWDTKADMTIRDIAINERIPSIQELEYFMAYKGGQSVWRFIAEKYGREKIGEIFHAMKNTGNAEKGFKRALGLDFDDLTKQWHKYIKKEYWPDVAGRDEVGDIAKSLTDHKEQKNYYNVSPTISPDGSKIAVLSDRSGYMDIYIIDAINGKQKKQVVKGNRSMDFEELKFLQPGITWSPDNKKIVIAAKSGAYDALHIINIKDKKREKIEFELDGVFTAAWSPDGKILAFIGNEGGFSNIYAYYLDSKEMEKVTNDVYSDSEPSWSPDSKFIAFVSDRGANINPGVTSARDMINHDYSQKDLYTVNLKTKQIQRITDTDYNENYPVWTHTKSGIFYAADYNGIWNIFYHDFEDRKSSLLTNLLTGAFQLSLTENDQTLIFSGYSGLGWDVFRINNPLEMDQKEVDPTNYISQKEFYSDEITDLRRDKRRRGESLDRLDFSNYIFSWDYESYNEGLDADEDIESREDSTVDENGNYIPQIYKTRFSLDLVNANFGYNTLFGAQGITVFWFSDIMGDHQLSFGLETQISLSNSDYYLTYGYLKNRSDLYLTAFHQADFFNAGIGISEDGLSFTRNTARLRHYGLAAFVSRPFNRFQRIEMGFIWHGLSYGLFEYDELRQRSTKISSIGFSTINPTIGYVYDNTVFGFTGPVDGLRQNTSIEVNPGLGKNGVSYQKYKIDLRKYKLLGRNYTLAARFMFGSSQGKNPQKFFLGGMDNWLLGRGESEGVEDGNRWRNIILDSGNENILQDIYFSEYATPLRGTRYSERFGANVFLANFEFRFPFIDYFQLGFPARMIFGNIRGHLFLDIGAAWDSPKEFSDHERLEIKYNSSVYEIPDSFTPWVKTFGYGIKLPFFALWRIEAAYDVLPNKISKPQWYLSIGYDW
ncbi:MAG: hypothetical protein V3S48_05650 [Candidatus Neomarinimicrobiota bacterium]